jgi:hypothetical protein
MFQLRTMAGLAIDAGVLTGFFDFEDVRVAGFAGFVTGMNDGQSGDFSDSIGAVMAILSKAFRNEPGTEAEKEGSSYQKDRGDPNQVLGVFEAIHVEGGCTCPATFSPDLKGLIG